MKTKNQITPDQTQSLLTLLKTRFEKNSKRHQDLEWKAIEAKLEANPEKLRSLAEMEGSGGEPDVVGEENGEYIFMDCAAESPSGRRSLCYDREGWESRKDFKPENTANDMAMEMGMELLTEEQYRELQKLGSFDAKTSSWLKTPPEIRKLGGAIFGDFRFGRVFIYHNGAQSYYGARGFRGVLKV